MNLPVTDLIQFADNPEPRCPCVLLLDISGSMEGEAIAALNQGLRAFKDALQQDPLASLRVEVAVVTFDDVVDVAQDFVTADQFEPPQFTAGGHTCMAKAILVALDMVDVRKAQYRANSISYFRPWIFMLTDGAPDVEPEEVVAQAAARIRLEENAKRVVFHAVGVGNADMLRLSQIVPRPPTKLEGLNFEQIFLWLSQSVVAVATEKAGEQVELMAPPVGPGR